jgi:hypothetical protein
VRLGLVLAVLVLNVAAIASILGTRATAGRKLLRITAVVLLPVIGALAWFAGGRRTQGPETASPNQRAGYDGKDGDGSG